jgi:crotonobetainyl-CoA:carnitine CoA-transferase CaiB-like acyl-CoA transferase
MTLAHQPLAGLLVVDLSQFLAGPYCTLRLQDMGARVIKIERPDGGDLTRNLYFSDTVIDGESTVFHAINRGKESVSLNLKDPVDVDRLKALVKRADVFVQNYRPGVIERLGLDYEAVCAINPRIIYASVSGYGPDSPWRDKPGQDLLAQARSGIMWLNGSAGDGPVPFGLAVADMMAGAAIAQGILGALVGRGITGDGAHVETSLLEALMDLQFEVLATHLNDGGRPPERSNYRSAHPALPAPYGVYPTRDGFLAVAMMPIGDLAEHLGLDALQAFADDQTAWFRKRDQIKEIIADALAKEPTDHWIGLLEPRGVWVAPVQSWPDLLADPAFTHLDMVQKVRDAAGTELSLIRSPIRINGLRGKSTRAAPEVGMDNDRVFAEFGL